MDAGQPPAIIDAVSENETQVHEHEDAAEHAHDDEGEHEHVHDHAAEERAHKLSMQCWRAALRAQSADDWAHAVELGRQAIELVPEAPEPRFNLAVALTGLIAWIIQRSAGQRRPRSTQPD